MSPPNSNRKHSQNRFSLVDRCSTIRACEPCRRRKRICNGQKPCSSCKTEANECVYSVVSDHPRGVFTTSTARRLSSGSACETCRRRKTKCDGGQPCAFCSTNNLKCVNNAERRKRPSMSVPSVLSTSSTVATSPTLSSSALSSTMATNTNRSASPSSTATAHLGNASSDHEAMDRIEDRLRRIEQLMTVFTPSPLSQSTVFPDDNVATYRGSSNNNRNSSSNKGSSGSHMNISTHFVRQQRHSVQGISVAKEQLELQIARRAVSSSPPQFGYSSSTSSDLLHAGAYITPPNSGGKKHQQLSTRTTATTTADSSSPALSASPPLSPESPTTSMLRQTSNNSHPLTSSMLNLTLSPSSSTSSSSNTSSMHLPQSSLSTPLSDQHQYQHYGSLGSFTMYLSQPQQQQSSRDFHTIASASASPMPSLMDQLSKKTFTTNHLEYPVRSSYPIYPLTPSPPVHLQPTTTYAEASFSP